MMRTAIRRSVYGCLGIVVTMALLSGCASMSPRTLPTPTPWPTPVVAQKPTYTVQRGTVIDEFRLSGQVVPAQWEAVFFEVDGKLSSLLVAEGDKVKKGDLLAELEITTLQEQLASAMLSLEQVEDQLRQQESTRVFALERAKLNLELQQLSLDRLRRTEVESRPLQLAQAAADLEKAQVALERAQAAYDTVAWRPGSSALPQAAALQSATIDYEAALARYQLQKASDTQTAIAQQEIQVKLAELTVRELEEKIDPNLERNIAKAQIQVQTLERQIEERRLRAPFDGAVVAIGINLEGLRSFAQRPKVGDSLRAYAPLIAVARPDVLEVVITSGAGRSNELTVGQVVTVTHPLDRNNPFAAQVGAMPVRSLGAGVQVQSIGQSIRLELPPDAPKMSIGDNVDITVIGALHADTLFLPPAAVRRFMGRTFVVLREENRERRVDISVGIENNTQIEVLSGLNDGDVVIGS
jgi:multidrug efflux pump subunit AcrA (membrane-fusion protein)